MKIKTKKITYEEFKNIPIEKHTKPIKQNLLLKLLARVISFFSLKKVNFIYNKKELIKINKKEPCLFLMNHSSFIDLKIVYKLLGNRRFNIICTDDGFVGKKWLMKHLGCIPTRKFTSDTVLVRDMLYTINNLKSSILLFPEASYSFDGTATPLPNSIGKCIKLLKVPVVMIKTSGAFLYDPLYNNLQTRDVDVSARITCLFTKDKINNYSVNEINEYVNSFFKFDHFKYQQQNKIKINFQNRADFLDRMLYKCPHCLKEGYMEGKGTTIKCLACNATYELTDLGFLKGINTDTVFNHIPDWYKWERKSVSDEVNNNNYYLKANVHIYGLKNYKCLYDIGKGQLIHTIEGFFLTGEDNDLSFHQSPTASYSLYSDFYWYELGDVICIGDEKVRYYCIPIDERDIVAKARLATEEIYKLYQNKKK